MRKKTLNTVLMVLGIVSFILFLTAGWFISVYFRSEMVKEYGEQFTTAVEYCFGLGWLFALAGILGSEAVGEEV